MAALLALAGLLASYAYFAGGDFGGLAIIAGLPGGAYRRRRYRVRTAKTLLLFGATALVALLVVGRLGALVRMPDEFAPLLVAIGGPSPDIAGAVAIGAPAGSAIGVAWAWWRGRGGKLPAMVGDYAAMLPRDRGEAALAFAAALAAGLGEELYFRLALPLLVTTLSGSAVLGVVVSTLLFGGVHRYQRWPGVLASMTITVLFSALYLTTGALWLAIAVHALMDVNGLVLRPWAAGMVRARADD